MLSLIVVMSHNHFRFTKKYRESSGKHVLKCPYTTNSTGVFFGLSSLRLEAREPEIADMYYSLCKDVEYRHCQYFILQPEMENAYVSIK
jgi:hypothetical protein